MFSVFAAMLALPDAAQNIPLAGSAVLFGMMFKIVWSARKDWAVERATMKAEWVAEKADLIAQNDKALVRMQDNCTQTTDSLRRVHVDEVASLTRRLEALEAEVLRGKE